MEKTLLIAILFSFVSIGISQNLRTIAAYDNESSYTSGIYGVGDTALYRYSWYYQSWFPLSNNGLVKVNDTVQIGALAVYNNYSSNSSGLFVFSDTAVYNYNWIMATWYPLSNNGLPRKNNKPDVKKLAVYGDSGSSSNSKLFALTDTAVYQYIWFYQAWTALSNNGLPTFAKEKLETTPFEAIAYPNPFTERFSIEVTLPENHSGQIELAIFDSTGKLIHTEKHATTNLNKITIEPQTGQLPQGLYFCEISDGKKLKQLKVINLK